MPLALDYRPRTLEEFFGNDSIKESLKSILAREDKPKTLLFSGPSGCGKTTLSRIVASMLGCSDMDLVEHNISNMRGIDTAREIIASCQFEPLYGDVRVIILNECFAMGTQILVDRGLVPIENIRVGDKVKGVGGFLPVKNTFKNMVPLSRVVKVYFTNGVNLICSEDHLFLTNTGEWVSAKNLKGNFTFGVDSSIMGDIKALNGGPYGKERLRMVQNRVSNSISIRKKTKVLFSKMRLSLPGVITWGGDSKIFTRTKRENACRYSRTFRSGQNPSKSFEIPTNEGEQPFKESFNRRKNESNKKNKWHTKYLAWEKGWKWPIDYPSNFAFHGFGMGTGIDYLYQNEREGDSPSLYSGCSQREIKNSYRGGRSWTSVEREFIIGQKEGRDFEGVGVESVEVYEHGNNEESFKSVITNKERSQGFVEFYDLEIEGHPSYYANGILAHNCHKATNEFQNAMLEILEEPPSKVFFILCTTEPEKLLKTIKTRATTYTVSPLKKHDMANLINWVLTSEKVSLTDKVKSAVMFSAEGCARKAMVILDQIIDLQEEEKQLDAINENTPDETTVIDLCRKIMAKDTGPNRWKEISVMLKGIDQEAEGVRRAILGYLSAVLINGDHKNGERVVALMSEFMNNYYDSGKSGLIASCYMSTLI